MSTFNFSQFETYKAFLNYWPTATNSTGYYSSDSNNWGFVEAVSKLSYLISSVREMYFIKKFYKHIDVTKWQENNPFEATHYDSYYIKNNMRYFLEFKYLLGTSVNQPAKLFQRNLNDPDSIDFLKGATVMLHTKKVKDLVQAQKEENERLKLKNKEVKQIVYLCYLEADKTLVYESMANLVKNPTTEKGFAYQDARTIDSRNYVPKESYYPLISSFKTIANVEDNLTVQNVIAQLQLDWLLDKEAEWLLEHIIASNKFKTEHYYKTNLYEIKHYTNCKQLETKDLIEIYKQNK